MYMLLHFANFQLLKKYPNCLKAKSKQEILKVKEDNPIVKGN